MTHRVNVAVEIGKGWTLPVIIQMPRLMSPHPTLLGLGDIIIPGLFLCFLFRFDVSAQGTPCKGLCALRATRCELLSDRYTCLDSDRESVCCNYWQATL